jgi:hypothetical protein
VLSSAGARSTPLAVFDQALTADAVFDGLAVEPPEAAPLACLVPDRTLSELLAWPLTGTPPRQLRNVRARLHAPTGTRDELAAGLRHAAGRTRDSERSAMLRRQARFLVASHDASRQWIEDAEAREQRRPPDLREWSPEWPVARSRAVSAALVGDPEPLRRFTAEGLSTDRGIDANLRYWAYWVGEIQATWTADAEMLAPQTYSGELLLRSLVAGLELAPYRELCAHTVWALLLRRPGLAEHPDLAARLRRAIEVTTSTPDTLSTAALGRLDQVAYRIGS